MELVVEDGHRGTDERNWLGASQLVELRPVRGWRPWWLIPVALRPKNEVLVRGGLIQHKAGVRTETVVVAVSDGEASHSRACALGVTLL